MREGNRGTIPGSRGSIFTIPGSRDKYFFPEINILRAEGARKFQGGGGVAQQQQHGYRASIHIKTTVLSALFEDRFDCTELAMDGGSLPMQAMEHSLKRENYYRIKI